MLERRTSQGGALQRDMCVFLENESGVPLRETTNKVLEMLCEPSDKGFSIRSAGLQLVVSQLDTFCSKSTEQLDALIQEHDELKCGVDEGKEHVEEVERIRRAAMFSDNCYFGGFQYCLVLVTILLNCACDGSFFKHTSGDPCLCRDIQVLSIPKLERHANWRFASERS